MKCVTKLIALPMQFLQNDMEITSHGSTRWSELNF